MHAGALVARAFDRADAARFLHSVLDPYSGFCHRPFGDLGDLAWTWSFEQDRMGGKADAFRVKGPLVNFSGAVGLPFARLRLMLPEELMPGRPRDLTGRRGGLSASWLETQTAEPGQQAGVIQAVRALWGVKVKVAKGKGGSVTVRRQPRASAGPAALRPSPLSPSVLAGAPCGPLPPLHTALTGARRRCAALPSHAGGRLRSLPPGTQRDPGHLRLAQHLHHRHGATEEAVINLAGERLFPDPGKHPGGG